MIAYKDLKVGMEVEALSAGEWLPARVVRLPESATCRLVDVELDRGGAGSRIFLEAGARHHGEVSIGLDLIRPKREGPTP
jgi:hypothetical protein